MYCHACTPYHDMCAGAAGINQTQLPCKQQQTRQHQWQQCGALWCPVPRRHPHTELTQYGARHTAPATTAPQPHHSSLQRPLGAPCTSTKASRTPPPPSHHHCLVHFTWPHSRAPQTIIGCSTCSSALYPTRPGSLCPSSVTHHSASHTKPRGSMC